MGESRTKTGWWIASFDLTLDGEDTRFEDLSEVSQEHIAKCILDGCFQGEIVEESDDDEEEEPEEPDREVDVNYEIDDAER